MGYATEDTTMPQPKNACKLNLKIKLKEIISFLFHFLTSSLSILHHGKLRNSTNKTYLSLSATENQLSEFNGTQI